MLNEPDSCALNSWKHRGDVVYISYVCVQVLEVDFHFIWIHQIFVPSHLILIDLDIELLSQFRSFLLFMIPFSLGLCLKFVDNSLYLVTFHPLFDGVHSFLFQFLFYLSSLTLKYPCFM